MAALLTSVLDSQEKVGDYIAECRATGIQILPPDINQSGPDFTVVGEHIRFGLSALKGVGRGFTKALLFEREQSGPFASFPDFCRRMLDIDLNKRVLDSLIRSGAFDSMDYRRAQLLDAYEQLIDALARSRKKNLEGQFDLFGQGGEDVPELVQLQLRDLPEFSPQELMRMEKEVTGLYLSGHPMDAYRETMRRSGAFSIGSILSDFAQEGGPSRYQDNQKATLAGVVGAVKTKTTKNNSLMAYVTIEDDSGSMELLAFSRVLEAAGSYLKMGVPLLVKGRISVRDEKAPQLLCDEILPLSHLPQGGEASPRARDTTSVSKEGKLYLRLPSEEDPRFAHIRKLFLMFPGESQAIFYFPDSGRRLGAHCLLHEALLTELRALLGEESVVLK